MNDQTTGFQVNADINPFEQSMRRMVDAARNGQQGVSGAFSQLEGLKTLFIGIGAAFGMIKMADFVTHTLEAAGGLKDLSQKTGMSVEGLSGLGSVAKLSGTSLDVVAEASNKLSHALYGATEGSNGAAIAIKSLGLNFAEFKAMSPEDRLMAVAKAMAEMQDGSNKTAIAMELFGKKGANLLPFLADLGEAGKISAKITTEQANAADNFGDNLMRLNANGDAWKKTLVYGMAPALSKASDAFVSVFQKAGGLKEQIAKLTEDGSIERWTKSGVIGLSYLADIAEVVARAFKGIIATVGTAILQSYSLISGLGQAVKSAMSGDFDGAAEAMKKGFDKSKKYGQEWKQEMADLLSADTLGAKFRAAMANGEGKGNGRYKDAPDEPKNKGTREPSQMPIYEAELAKKIAAFEKAAQAEGTLRQYSKEDEAKYWKEVSERAGVTAEDKARAEKKWRDLERGLRAQSFAVEMADLEQRKQELQNNFAQRITLAEQAHAKTVAMYGAESKEAALAWGKVLEEKRKQTQQLIQIDNIAGQRRRDKALSDIEAERQDADLLLAMGLITKEQQLQQQLGFEQRMYAIKLQALQASLALVDPEKDPVKKAEIDAQIEQLETQHQLRLKGIRNALAAQVNSPELNIFNGMQTAFESTINGLLTRAQSLREAMGSIFKSMYGIFVQEIVTKPLAMLAVRAIRETALYKMMAGAAVANQAAASGATVAIVEAEQAPKLAAIAPVAGAKAAESQASTPYIGPILAAAAFAAMVKLVMSGGRSSGGSVARVPSAAGGFDIPKGLNPMTQLHEQEMVLPARYADVIRSMGDGGGGSGSGKPSQTVHNWNISAFDGKDVKRVLMANQGALVESLSKAYRNGHRP